MQLHQVFITLIVTAGLVAGLTLPEAAAQLNRRCASNGNECFVPNPGACCSGECICGIECTPSQLAGETPGVSAHLFCCNGDNAETVPFIQVCE
ncbi:hypothetical protein K439DRAFT_1633870 [Ramaria rubella]|nr:hypothetical protein K439DRAFT_1633870 [Ramaria rubella]